MTIDERITALGDWVEVCELLDKVNFWLTVTNGCPPAVMTLLNSKFKESHWYFYNCERLGVTQVKLVKEQRDEK